MENKSFLGLVVSFFKEIFLFLKEILFEGNENELLQVSGVKKGFKNGFKYGIWLLILPIKIGKYFANPDFRVYHFLEKMITPFLFISDILSGRNSNIVAKTFESFIEKLKSGGTTELKANIADIDVFRNLFIIRKIVTGILFVILVCLGAFWGFSIFETVADMLNVGGLLSGIVAGGGTSALITISSLGIFGILNLIIFLIALSFYAYIIFICIKITAYIIRDSYILKPKQMQNFLFEVIDYTYKKTKQIYGEELAQKALFAILENFILKEETIDMLEVSELSSKQDFEKLEIFG